MRPWPFDLSRTRENVAMSELTSFHIGGPADAVFEAESAEEIAAVRAYCKAHGLRSIFLGRGSNVLVDDRGYRGVVILAGPALSQIVCDGTKITAGCGVSLAKLAQTAREHALTGLEFAGGIPGSFGGAVYMNAGAYDGEMSQVLDTITYVDDEGTHMIAASDAAFSYRHSRFMEQDSIIVSASVVLRPGNQAAIGAKMADLNTRRRDKQPLEYPSAGSMFKRPEGYFAGKLIEDAGLGGYRVGDAQISEKHCGFVINVGHATCAEVRQLVREVHERVLEKDRVEIWPEVRYLSEIGWEPLL